MLKQISFDVEIQNDGRPVFSLNRFSHTFAPGLTAITGRNGTGKSMVPEMAMYALFGSKALRGKSDDYKTLNVTLEAEVNGRGIKVMRSKKTALLLEANGAEIASGTEPVNKAILDLFGYSFDVFNIANAAKQGEIERLGAMKPAERKRLVDETVGVNVLDALEAYIAGEIRAAKAVVDTLGATQELPTEPVLDSEFTREDIDHQLAAFEALRVEKAKLTAVVESDPGAKPVEPVAPEGISDLESEISKLQSREEARNRLVGELSALKNQQLDLGVRAGDARPEKPVAPEWIDQENELRQRYVEWSDASTRLKAKKEDVERLKASLPELPPAVQTITDIDEARAFLRAYESNVEKIALRDRLRKEAIPQECPACGHKYETADPRLAELEDLLPINPLPYTADDIDTTERADAISNQMLTVTADILRLQSTLHELGDNPGPKLDAIIEYRGAARDYEKFAKFDELQAKIDAIVVPESVQGRIAALNAYAVAVAAWKRDAESWQQKHDAIVAAEVELYSAKYSIDIDAEIAKFSDEKLKHVRHEYALKAYRDELQRVEAVNEQIAKAAVALEQWSRCRKAIPLVRAKVKGFLLPSLNRAGSVLISEMTGGVFSSIAVSEEFDIAVDGQRIETLSGGGKAVANLALRLGLGQVLTNRVFSTVLLDEVDTACDAERASSMAQAIRHLTERDIIRQIVLISHKDIEADHVIRMEEFDGQQAMEAAA